MLLKCKDFFLIHKEGDLENTFVVGYFTKHCETKGRETAVLKLGRMDAIDRIKLLEKRAQL